MLRLLQAHSGHSRRCILTLASLSASMMPPVCSCRRAYALWRAWYSFVNCRNLSSDSSAAKLLRLKKKTKNNYVMFTSCVHANCLKRNKSLHNFGFYVILFLILKDVTGTNTITLLRCKLQKYLSIYK